MVGLLSPAVALGAILSTAYAALFHLWTRGKGRALGAYLLATWLGFAGGHLAAQLFGVHLFRIGQLEVLGGTFGAIIAMLIAHSMEA